MMVKKGIGAKKADTKTRKKVLDEAKNWYADRYQLVVVQRNVLFLITILALAGLGGSVFAVAILNASKTFEPYLIQIEDKTGITTQITRGSIERYKADEAITRYFLVKYIQARESYNVSDYTYFYTQVVRVFSQSGVYRYFRRKIDVNTPGSPLKLGRNATKTVEIKSITFLESGKAQVRFGVYQRGGTTGGGGLERASHLIATINFDYLPLDLTMQERYINPLGFQVKSYRIDEDRSV